MKKMLYTIKDTKVGVYLEPFFTHDDENAIRSITYAVNDDSHPFSKHPEGFSLFRVGSYDDSVCKFDLLSSPEHMLNLEDLVK